MNTVCSECGTTVLVRPKAACTQRSHFDLYCDNLQFELRKANEALEMRDEDRDKLDVAEVLRTMPKVRTYTCHGCGKQFELPIHLVHVVCACGRRCRLRHVGGVDPIGDVIDAAMTLLGTERIAQLAYLTETYFSYEKLEERPDKVKEFIQQVQYEMDRWYMDSEGWRRKK